MNVAPLMTQRPRKFIWRRRNSNDLPKSSIFVKVSAWVILALILIPIPIMVWMSFFEGQFLVFPPTGYSTDGYSNLAHQPQLMSSFFLSLRVALAAALISTLLGFLGALAIHRSTLPYKNLLSSSFVLPLAIPTIVSGLAVYLFLYDLSRQLGAGLVPSFGALVGAHVVITLPWTFRFIYAGLSGLAVDAERAAMDLGSGPFSTVWRITLPLLKSSLVGAFILAFVFSFQDLEMALFLVSPGEQTLPIAMLQYAQFSIDPTIAAMSVIQVVIVAILLIVTDRFVGFGQVFAGGTKG